MTAEEKIGHVLGISGFLGRLPGPDVTRFARFQVVSRAKSIIGYGVKLLNETRAWYYTDPGPVPIMTLTSHYERELLRIKDTMNRIVQSSIHDGDGVIGGGWREGGNESIPSRTEFGGVAISLRPIALSPSLHLWQ